MIRNVDPNKLRPVSNRVLIRKDEKSNEIDGVLITESNKAKTDQLTGEVISVGDGKPGEKMITKKGDVVMFGEYSGTKVGKEEDRLIIMEEHHILCILDNESKSKK